MVKAVTSRALMVGSMVGQGRDQLIPSTVPILLVSSMVKMALLLLLVVFHMVSQVITVGSTVRTALSRLLMVSQAITAGSTVRLGVTRVLQGVWGGPQTGLLRLSGMVKQPKEQTQVGQTTAIPPTITMGPFLHRFRVLGPIPVSF